METGSSKLDAFRHKLIQEEFRSILTADTYRVPNETNGVVVLSAPFVKDEKGNVIEASADNVARIEMGIEVAKQIAAAKSGKNIDEVSSDDILQYSPPLILNGETEQLPAMKEVARGLGFPTDKTQEVDCGRRGVGNTKTQFQVLNTDPRFENATHLTFITNAWHDPRVERTAITNLNPEIHFDVIPVPHDRVPYNVFRVIRGEVKRIETYSAKGDIAREPL